MNLKYKSKPEPGKVRMVSVRIPETLFNQVRERLDKTRITLQEVIRVGLTKFLVETEDKREE